MSDAAKASVPTVCPGCGKSFRAPASALGKSVKCKCGQSWKLEAPAAADHGDPTVPVKSDATHKAASDPTRTAVADRTKADVTRAGATKADATRGSTTKADATTTDRTRVDPMRAKLAAAKAAAKAKVAAPAAGELPAGVQIGNFEILRIAGRGSMGAVYEARDRLLDRKVALKVMPDNLSAEQLPEFLARANVTNVLLHPNILAIFQVGKADDRRFLVEELGESGSAADFIEQRGRMLPADAVRVAACAARGLAAAHGRGVLHRNVHPNNILLGEGWAVRIADFGVTDALSAMGVLPSEAAPAEFASTEFCMGQATDARSDVYSLGAVLFYLLTGRAPYVGRTRAAVMTGHTDGVLPDPRSIAEDVPDSVAGIVQKAMAKSPAARYATAAEFAADLEAVHAELAPEAAAAPIAVEAGSGQVARDTATAARSAPLPVKKPAWMHPMYLGGAAAALALLVVGGIFLFRGGEPVPDAGKARRGNEAGDRLLQRLVGDEGLGAAAAKKLLGGVSTDHQKSIDNTLGADGGATGPRKLIPNLNPGIGQCPVCGDIGRLDIAVEHKGRKPQFCSERCANMFKQNPGKYESKLGG